MLYTEHLQFGEGVNLGWKACTINQVWLLSGCIPHLVTWGFIGSLAYSNTTHRLLCWSVSRLAPRGG